MTEFAYKPQYLHKHLTWLVGLAWVMLILGILSVVVWPLIEMANDAPAPQLAMSIAWPMWMISAAFGMFFIAQMARCTMRIEEHLDAIAYAAHAKKS